MKEKKSIFHYGNIKHNAIVFIHGFPFDNYMWKNQVEALRERYFCVTYDVRGLGNFPYGDGQFTIEDLVDDLEDIIHRSGIDRPVICGLSMGGYIALRAVERNEKNFRGLILCDTKSEADNNTSRLKRAEAIRKINFEGAAKFVEEFISPLIPKSSIENLGDDYIKLLGRSMLFAPSGLKGCLLAMAGRTDTTDYLTRIAIPVLLICGAEDNLTTPETMRIVAEKIKDSEFYIIKSAGHLAPFEEPSVVNGHIIKFLNKINETS